MTSKLFNSVISIIKFWNTELNYIVVFTILRSFNLLNKFYLKNKFFKFVKNLFMWNQLSKMLMTNKIGISSNSIYNSMENFCISTISCFLLNLYLIEFDIYLEKLMFRYNFNKNFDQNSQLYDEKLFSHVKILNCFAPLKFVKNLLIFKKLKFFVSLKYTRFFDFFINNFHNTYNTNVYGSYVRYLDFLVLGFTSSKIFISFVLKKLQNFLQLKSNFNIKKLSIFNSRQKNIIYLFYNLNLHDRYNKLNSSNLRTNALYFAKVFFRIIINQKRILNTLFKRFKLEFGSNLKYMFDNKLKFFDSVKSFSILGFQLEAIGSTKIHKLVEVGVRKNFVSNNILSEIRLFDNKIYGKYLFNLYDFKTQRIFDYTLDSFISCFLYGSFSNDFFLYNCLLEFKKSVLLKNNIYANNFFFFHNNKYLFSHFYAFDMTVYTRNFGLLPNKLLEYHTFLEKNSSNLSKSFFFLIPFNLLIEKLRLLGFVHSFNSNPVSNLSLIFFSDDFIIKSSSYIVYVLLCWFRFCDNFSELQFFIKLIRESCLLTLCRKHNKTRSWIYNLYTYDLLIFKNLYYCKFFFPNIKFIKELKNKKYFLQENLPLDEFLLI